MTIWISKLDVCYYYTLVKQRGYLTVTKNVDSFYPDRDSRGQPKHPDVGNDVRGNSNPHTYTSITPQGSRDNPGVPSPDTRGLKKHPDVGQGAGMSTTQPGTKHPNGGRCDQDEDE